MDININLEQIIYIDGGEQENDININRVKLELIKDLLMLLKNTNFERTGQKHPIHFYLYVSFNFLDMYCSLILNKVINDENKQLCINMLTDALNINNIILHIYDSEWNMSTIESNIEPNKDTLLIVYGHGNKIMPIINIKNETIQPVDIIKFNNIVNKNLFFVTNSCHGQNFKVPLKNKDKLSLLFSDSCGETVDGFIGQNFIKTIFKNILISYAGLEDFIKPKNTNITNIPTFEYKAQVEYNVPVNNPKNDIKQQKKSDFVDSDGNEYEFGSDSDGDYDSTGGYFKTKKSKKYKKIKKTKKYKKIKKTKKYKKIKKTKKYKKTKKTKKTKK
jgi:hypothetical protein